MTVCGGSGKATGGKDESQACSENDDDPTENTGPQAKPHSQHMGMHPMAFVKSLLQEGGRSRRTSAILMMNMMVMAISVEGGPVVYDNAKRLEDQL